MTNVKQRIEAINKPLKYRLCPFCGSENIGLRYDGQPATSFYMCCENCDSTSTPYFPVNAAGGGFNPLTITAWNKRPIEDEYKSIINEQQRLLELMADALGIGLGDIIYLTQEPAMQNRFGDTVATIEQVLAEYNKAMAGE